MLSEWPKISPTIHLINEETEKFDVVYRVPNSNWVGGINKTDKRMSVDVFPTQNVLRIESENVHRTEQPKSVQHYGEELPLSAEDMLNAHEYVIY